MEPREDLFSKLDFDSLGLILESIDNPEDLNSLLQTSKSIYQDIQTHIRSTKYRKVGHKKDGDLETFYYKDGQLQFYFQIDRQFMPNHLITKWIQDQETKDWFQFRLSKCLLKTPLLKLEQKAEDLWFVRWKKIGNQILTQFVKKVKLSYEQMHEQGHVQSLGHPYEVLYEFSFHLDQWKPAFKKYMGY